MSIPFPLVRPFLPGDLVRLCILIATTDIPESIYIRPQSLFVDPLERVGWMTKNDVAIVISVDTATRRWPSVAHFIYLIVNDRIGWICQDYVEHVY